MSRPASSGAALVLLLAASLPAAAEEPEAPPRDLAGRIRRQDGMVARGETERALAEARERAAREPRDPEALYLLGRVLGNAGKVEEARVQFEGALELDVHYPPAWRGMALVHLRQREYETAAREARKAFELDPSVESVVILANCLQAKGDRPGAHRVLQEALAKSPGDNDLRSFYASLLINDQLYRDAEKELRQVIASEPGHLPARQALVFLLVNTGRRDEAAAECREAARRSPGDPRPRLLLRDLLVEKEDFAGAAAVMEEALKLDLSPADRAKAAKDLEGLRAAAEAPREERPPDPAEVLKKLESTDAAERREAMRTLWERDLRFLPEAALRRVTDPDEGVRVYAVRLLGRYGDARAAGLLEVVLFHPKDRDPSAAVRAAAAEALGRLGTPAALPVLMRAVGEPEEGVFRAAVRGVQVLTGKCLLGDPEAPVPEAEGAAIRERYRRWWLENPTGRHWRRKTAEAVGGSGMRSLAWYVVPWILEDDPRTRASALDCMAVLTGDAGWRTVAASTPEERAAARDRAYRALSDEPETK